MQNKIYNKSKLERFKLKKDDEKRLLKNSKIGRLTKTENFSKDFFIYKSDDVVNFKSCDIKKYYEKDKLKEAEQIIKGNKKKKKIWNWILIVANLGIITGVFIKEFLADGVNKNVSHLWNDNSNFWWMILFLFLACGAYTLIESLKLHILIYKATRRHRPFLSYKAMAIGRYYDNITPMATGGRAFQIFYFNKRGIRGDMAASIPLVRQIYWQITYCIVAIFVLMSSGASNIFSADSVMAGLIKGMAWGGLATNAGLLIIIMFLSISKKWSYSLVKGVLKFLHKIKIVKDYNKTYAKVRTFVANYQQAMRYYTTNWNTIVVQVLLAFLSIIAMSSMPYIVYWGLKDITGVVETYSFFNIFSRVIMCELAANLIPLPGGTGVAELAFATLQAPIFGTEVVWAMLIWRLFSYFFFILQGVGVYIYDLLIGNKKAQMLMQNGYFTNNFMIKIRKINKEKKVKKLNR